MSNDQIEDKLAVNKFDVDDDVHIRLHEEKCKECEDHVCLYICPAECFEWVEDHISFSHKGCLECGSCRIVCDTEAFEWALPRGGFGICYQYG
jgi:ferredoxin like protein